MFAILHEIGAHLNKILTTINQIDPSFQHTMLLLRRT